MNVLNSFSRPGFVRYEEMQVNMVNDHMFKVIVSIVDTDGLNDYLVEKNTKIIDVNALDKYKDDYIRYSVYAIRTRVTPDYRDGLAK